MLKKEDIRLGTDTQYHVNRLFLASIRLNEDGEYILSFDEADYFIKMVNSFPDFKKAVAKISLTPTGRRYRTVFISPSPELATELDKSEEV